MRAKEGEFQIWPNVDEFEIYDNKTLKRIAKCYREVDKNSIGWCGTNSADDINNQKFNIHTEKGWGFCSKDCIHDPDKPLFGRPTTKKISILDGKFCEAQLTNNGKLTYVVKPEVLCVAQNLSYNIRTYLKGEEEDDYYHVKAVDLRRHSRLQKLVKREIKRYIVGRNKYTITIPQYVILNLSILQSNILYH